MAFANLFTKLSVISKDVKGPGEAAFSLRNPGGNNGKSYARKRKPKAERSGPYRKKQCYQDHKMDTYNAMPLEYPGWKAMHSNWQNTGNERASIGFTTENNHQHKAYHTDMFQKGPNYTTKNEWNSQQQERGKTKKRQKHLHHEKDKRKNTNADGRHQTRVNLKSGGKVWKHNKGTRMSKDVQVKFTRSMTEDFKEQNALSFGGQLICRHHLWGRCIKGDDCQLAHIQGCNDLIKEACKFYIQGCCTKGESCPYMHKSFPCKFFHSKGKCYQDACCRFSHEPLNEVTKRLLDEALKRETEHELASKAEQDVSEQPAKTDECEITDTNTASDLLIQPVRPNFYNSRQTTAVKEALLDQDDEPSNNMEQTCPTLTQPHSSPHSESIQEGPVCYSVEAVLGRQHFKPFPSFVTTRLSQESASFTSDSVDQSEVPYSVNAVLRSYKSAENSTVDYAPSPPSAQTQCEDVTEVSRYQVHAGLLSQTCSDSTLVSRYPTKQEGEIPESPKTEQSVSHQVKLGLLYSPFPEAEKSSKSKRDMKESMHLPDVTCSLSTKGKNLTPKHLAKLKPHVSAQTSVPWASVRPIGSSTYLSQSKIGVAVSTEPNTGSDKTADSGNSAHRFVKTAAEPDKTSTRSFADLFAAPLLPAPVPSQPQAHELGSASCSQESNHSVSASHLTDSRPSASDSQLPHQCQAKIDETSHRLSSPELTTSPRNENEKSLNQCEKPQVDSSRFLHDSLSHMSSSLTSYKGSAAASAANSVLKSLFLSLSPYQQDGEQQGSLQLGGPSGGEKNKSSTECVFKTQPKNTRKKQKNRQSCSEELVPHSTKPQPFLQTPHMSLEAAGGSTLCSPATFKPLVRSSGTSDSPSRVAKPAVQQHTPSTLTHGRCVDGNEAVTPLKDLFKTLDRTVFHFGP